MKSLLTATLALAIVTPCSAQHKKTFPLFTGQQLVDMVAAPPGAINLSQLSVAQQIAHDRASHYLSGVRDATEGVAWCNSGRLKPDALEAELIWTLRALKPDQLTGGAGPIVVGILKDLMPCGSKS